ncbi:MAG TPA: VanZ family protein, partial [Flavisolibacter sp.]|nr:VanZ family protein [Flavisolibacter sp.]
PFGFLLSLALMNKARFATVVACTFLLSFLFELYQLLSHTGQCDVDDIILNTTGGMMGFLFFRLAQLTFRRQRATSVSRSSISQLPR